MKILKAGIWIKIFLQFNKIRIFQSKLQLLHCVQVEKASLLKDFTLWKWEVLALGLFGVMIFMGYCQGGGCENKPPELNAITDDIVEYSKSYEINGSIINRQDELVFYPESLWNLLRR